MRRQLSSSAGFRVKSISSPYLRGPSECIACSCWCIRTTLAAMASLTSASLSSRSAIAGSRVARPQGALTRTVLHSGDVQRCSDPPFGDLTHGNSAWIEEAVRRRVQYQPRTQQALQALHAIPSSCGVAAHPLLWSLLIRDLSLRAAAQVVQQRGDRHSSCAPARSQLTRALHCRPIGTLKALVLYETPPSPSPPRDPLSPPCSLPVLP